MQACDSNQRGAKLSRDWAMTPDTVRGWMLRRGVESKTECVILPRKYVLKKFAIAAVWAETDMEHRAQINESFNRMSEMLAVQREEAQCALETEFRALADQWRKETRMLSFVRQKAVHPAYQQIIGMGKEALPFIFDEMKNRGGDWLWALQAITRENPASGTTSFKEAVAAWFAWARKMGVTQHA